MKKSYRLSFMTLLLLAVFIFNTAPVYADSTVMENTWSNLAPMGVARSYFGAVALNEKIYAIGGTDEVASGGDVNLPATSFTGGVIGTNEIYDPATNSWVSAASMPTARMGFGIATFQGKIYCFGGNTKSWSGGWDWRYVTGVTEIYYPTTDTWQTAAEMPYPVTDFQANLVNGKIYCIGGIDATGKGSELNQVYDPTTNTWSQSTALPISTFKYSSIVFDDKIYVINGIDWYSMHRLQRTQIYDPQTDTWSLGESSPNADVGAGTATVGLRSPKLIYSIGSSQTQIYNPLNDTWSFGKEILPSRWGFAAVNIGDILYILGGTIITSNMNSVTATETQFKLVQQYLPIGYGTIRPALSVLSPQNQTFNGSSVPLVFAVDRAVSWAGYSLDGKANVTLNGNQTITDLQDGRHTITVYTNDTYGNFAVNNVDFSVELPPFPTLYVTGILVVAVIAIGMLVIFIKKHKKFG